MSEGISTRLKNNLLDVKEYYSKCLSEHARDRTYETLVDLQRASESLQIAKDTLTMYERYSGVGIKAREIFKKSEGVEEPELLASGK